MKAATRLRNALARLRPALGRKQATPVRMTPALRDYLLDALEQTEPGELACEEVGLLLDQFAEMVVRGEDAGRFMPLVQKHLDLCPDCRQEYEALLRAMRAVAA